MLPLDLIRCLEWYSAPAGEVAEDPETSASRDVFQARLDRLLRDLLQAGQSADESSLLVAVLGEVGNNSFDHNLGLWTDVSGCRLGWAWDRVPALFWVVDRGVGILHTLRRVDSSLVTSQQAIDAAFERVISGRAPERRGNGLKFVRSVVNGSDRRGLFCQSGGGVAKIGGANASLIEVEELLADVQAPGVAAVFAWSFA